MRGGKDLLLGLDEQDRRLITEVINQLDQHKAEILAAWKASFSEAARLPEDRSQHAEGLFAQAIEQFIDTMRGCDFQRFEDVARELGRHLADQKIPFTVVPLVVQYLTRSYVPFLNRYYEGSQLKRIVQLFNMVMQRYSLALAEGYFQRTRQDSNTAVATLQEVDRLKDDFLSIVSHEFRTPLNFIMAYASTLQENVFGELDDAQQDAIGKILEGADRLNRLVDELMKASYAIAGKLDVYPIPFEVKPILEETTARWTATCNKPGIALLVDVPEDLPAVQADPERFGEILMQLLANACKFTEKGEVRLTGHESEQQLCFQIRDTGIGMSEEELSNVFARFYQAEPARTHHKPGTGLGLFIVKSLVDKMKGNIRIESEKGKGTMVTVCLPKAT